MQQDNWRFYVGMAALVPGRVRGDIPAASAVKEEIDSLLSDSFFQNAPFKRIGLMIRYGTKTDLEPKYHALHKDELPITVEVEMSEIRKFRGDALVEAFREIVLEALIRVAARYGLSAEKLISLRDRTSGLILTTRSSESIAYALHADQFGKAESHRGTEDESSVSKRKMSDEEFWSVIELTRAQTNDCDQQAALLSGLLESYSPIGIIAFSQHLATALNAANRWDIWGVAYAIYGDCSDDSCCRWSSSLSSLFVPLFDLSRDPLIYCSY